MQIRILIRLLPLVLVLLPGTLFSQKYSISGYIKEAETGEDMISARVEVVGLGQGTLSNEYGFYSITLPQGNYTIAVHYMGYSSDTQAVSLNANQIRNFNLDLVTVQMKTVEITTDVKDENVKSMEMSTATMSVELVKKLPAFMGEVDVIRTIQLLPGVQAVGDGITGYYVRGGESNQNLILLDEATVYNASHLLGFFSVFNSDALKDEYKLFKGGIPSQYGGRLSSVLDLRMKEGNLKRFHGSGGIGIISSRLSLEGPFVKDKGSFILSGRRTYGDLFLKLSKRPEMRDTKLYFYDFNAKANYRISAKDRIFLSGYFGRDVFKFRDIFSNDWGNATATLRWNHLFSSKLFSNTTLVYSDFKYGFSAETFSGDGFDYSSGIRDLNAKIDFEWYPNPKNSLQFGFNTTFHKFIPGIFEPTDTSFFQTFKLDPDYAFESGIYVSNEQVVSTRLSLDYGLRYSMFNQIGPGEEYFYNVSKEFIIDTFKYDAGELIKTYGGLEPRAGLRYIIDEKSSIKASYNRMRQYLHLASNTTASWPWDVWIPSSLHIPPQIADQVALGYFRNFFANQVETSIEVYYKNMRNQIDWKNGAELLLNPHIETEVLFGKGWAYGAEFFVKKKVGKLTGWVGYTLAWALRKIEGINRDEIYSAKNDRRHDASIVLNYDISKRISLAGTWIFATGNAVTFPVGKYYYEGHLVNFYGERNANRMPDYHRGDVALNLYQKPLADGQKRKFESSWNFSCYNAYGRRNAFAVSFEEDSDNPGTTNTTKIFLGRWIPSVTWNFKF